eukprot:1149196-Pelagomonas_calceolata.AAC.3
MSLVNPVHNPTCDRPRYATCRSERDRNLGNTRTVEAVRVQQIERLQRYIGSLERSRDFAILIRLYRAVSMHLGPAAVPSKGGYGMQGSKKLIKQGCGNLRARKRTIKAAVRSRERKCNK